MQIEHEVKVIPIDENYQPTLLRLQGEGWEMVPGVKPVAIYHVARMKKDGAVGRLIIDDSKVHIIPGNKTK